MSEKNEAYLRELVSQRRDIVLVSEFVRVKKNASGTLEDFPDKPKYCHIEGKDSLDKSVFKIVIGYNTLNIPYSTIKNVWEDKDSNKIHLELISTVVFDEVTTIPDKVLSLR